MLKDNFYIGDIKKCTRLRDHLVGTNGYVEYEDETIVYSSVLYKTKSGNYLGVDNYYASEAFMPNSIITKKAGIILKIKPTIEGEYFVDESTVRAYLKQFDEMGNKISPMKQLKKMFRR